MKLVDLNTAKTLLQLGYDGEYTHLHIHDTFYEKWSIEKARPSVCYGSDEYYPAPRLDDVAYWIRDTHNISIEICHHSFNNKWMASAYDMTKPHIYCYFDTEREESYDEALEAAVKEALKIIQNRQQ